MRAARTVMGQAAGGTILVLAGAASFAAVATAADGGGGLSAGVALQVGALRMPGLLLPLLPALCALAAGLAAARMAARGERRALELAGHAPARTALYGSCIGLAVGIAGAQVHDQVVPMAESLADRLGGWSDAPWVFMDGRAIRMRDGAVVVLDDDLITHAIVRPLSGREEATLAREAAMQRPARVSATTLAEAAGGPAQVERASRASRVVAAPLLAFFGWLPLARRPPVQVALAVTGGFVWAAGDVLLRAASAQGRVEPLVGAWGATVLVAVLAAGALTWVQRVRRPLA